MPFLQKHHAVDEGRDVVFFLGAGFSREAGLPVMADFGDASGRELERLRTRHGEAGRAPRNAYPLLREAGEMFTRFQEFCKGATWGVRLDTDNMETLFCIAEALQEAGDQPVTIDSAVHSPRYIIHQVQWWLWHIYNAARYIDDAVKRKPYEAFLEQLLPYSSRICILTTNYDLVLEYFAWRAGKACTYRLGDFLYDIARQAPDWREDHPFLPIFDAENSYLDEQSDDSLVVCKLHGSVNFFHRQVGPETWEFGISSDIAPKAAGSVGGSRIPSDMPAVLLLDAIWAMRAKFGVSLVPAIIPPTFAKLRGHGWLRETWSNAMRALQQARLVVFIGYSMPESDGFMRAMVQAAFASRRTREPPSIFVVDTSDHTHQRYAELFKPVGVQTEKGTQGLGFAEAVREGVFARALEAAEKRGHAPDSSGADRSVDSEADGA